MSSMKCSVCDMMNEQVWSVGVGQPAEAGAEVSAGLLAGIMTLENRLVVC